MSEKVSFHLLQIVPDRMRGEALNVGIVLDMPEGPEIRFHLLHTRLKALAPSFTRDSLEEWREAWIDSLQRFDKAELRWAWLKGAMAPLSLSNIGGTISSNGPEDFEAQINGILERLVVPQRLKSQQAKKKSRSFSLNAQLTSWLRAQRIYSHKLQDISKNRVVSSYPLSLSEELFAEFALKNGSLHVMETLDLRGHSSYTKSLRNEASHKALVLDVAQDELERSSQRIAVVSSDDYEAMKPAYSMLSRKASALISMESAQDRQWLADFVMKSLHLDTLLTPPAADQFAKISAIEQ